MTSWRECNTRLADEQGDGKTIHRAFTGVQSGYFWFTAAGFGCGYSAWKMTSNRSRLAVVKMMS